MTALTALLVLATLFTQVSASLPKTSYFKMVDIWLLFCIMLIFVIILFHTVIDLNIIYKDDSSTITSSAGARNGSAKLFGDITSIKVHPINGDPDELESNTFNIFNLLKLISFKLDGDKYILISKWAVFLIFGMFNMIYWGTLAFDSGLVYYG